MSALFAPEKARAARLSFQYTYGEKKLMLHGSRIDHLSIAIIYTFLFILSFQCHISAQAAAAAAPVNAEEAAKWREDLQVMRREMPKLHPNLFHSMTREQFEKAIKNLDEKIPMLARHQILVEMMRITSMAGDGDGHTSLNPQFNPKMEFRYYPLKLYLFKDGLFIQAADGRYADVVGARVIKIGNTPAEQAVKMVSEIVPHDNEMTFKQRVPAFMTMPEVLQALGLIEDMEKAQFLVENNGKQTIIELTPAGKLPQRSHETEEDADPAKSWVKMNDKSSLPLPLWLKSPQENYRFEYLEESKTIYVQYNKVFNKNGETIAAFARRVFEFAGTHTVDRFILDVRLNEGGNSFYNMPLLLGIIKSEKINRRGHLFTIIGRGTFSAAQNLVNELERYTNTLFVGEPGGAKPNFYGDHELVTLPNSGVTIAVSTLWWQMNPKDTRPWIAPSIAAELSSEDYRTNTDPAVNAILNYKSIAEVLEPALSAGNLKLAVKQYKDFKSGPETSPINTESDINALGYQLMNMNKIEQAVEILRLNTESYPNSSNAYDSLGDAYLRAGSKESAKKSYLRAMELNPKNDFTARKLQQLTGN